MFLFDSFSEYLLRLCYTFLFRVVENHESGKLLVPPSLSSILILHHLHLIVIVVVFTFIVIMRMSINSIVGFVTVFMLII